MPQNKEYIEREEALRQIFLEAMGHNFDFNVEYREVYLSAKRAIKNTPAADVVEVRHGRWVHNEDYESWAEKYVCSECNQNAPSDGDYRHSLTNYCPHCGAKMDKEE